MDPAVSKKLTKIITVFIILSIIPLLVYGLFYISSHGTLKIDTNLVVTKVEARKQSELTLSEHTGTSFHLEAGEYLIKIFFEGNQSFSQAVTIEGFLRTTTIIPSVQSKSFAEIIDRVNTNLLPLTKNEFLLFRAGIDATVYTIGGAVRAFQPYAIMDAFHNHQGTLMMASVNGNVVDYYYFDPQSNKSIFIAKQTLDDTSDIANQLRHGVDGFYILTNKTLHTVTQSGSTNIRIPDSIQYSFFSTSPIISKNASHIAFFHGNNFLLGSPAGDSRPIDEIDPLRDASINIYSLDSIEAGKEYASIPLERTRSISGILLSPSSKNLAIIYEGSLSVFDVKTRERIMTINSLTDIDNTFWIDDDSIVFIDNSFKLYRANTTRKEAYSILATNTLRISNISGIKDGLLYFTAFDSTRDGTQRLPSGYSIDLTAN